MSYLLIFLLGFWEPSFLYYFSLSFGTDLQANNHNVIHSCLNRMTYRQRVNPQSAKTPNITPILFSFRQKENLSAIVFFYRRNAPVASIEFGMSTDFESILRIVRSHGDVGASLLPSREHITPKK